MSDQIQSNTPRPRPTVGEIVTRVCQAAQDSGVIVTFGQPRHCQVTGRDMIEMRDPKGASHFVTLPGPANATARGDTFGNFMRNASIKPDKIFGAPSPARNVRFERDFAVSCDAV